MRWVKRAWLAAGAATILAGLALSPYDETRDLVVSRHGALVAGLYSLSVAVSILTLAYAAGLAGMKWREFAHAHETLSGKVNASVRRAMEYRGFWVALWLATAAVVANNVIPLTVVGEAPAGSTVGVYALLLCDDVFVVIPLRLWIFRLRRQGVPTTFGAA